MSAASVLDRANAPVMPVSSRQLLALSFYWLPTNLFWTVMLQSFLPGSVSDMVGDAQKGTYLLYISALGAIATTLIQLIIGPISDACGLKWGRRHPFIFAGTTLAAFCIIGFGLAGNFALLMAAFFGIQLFLNTATGPYQALMPDNIPASRHGLASAYMGGALLIGQLLGAVVLFGGAMLHIPRAPILIGLTLFLLVGMLVTVRFVPDRPAAPNQQKSPMEALQTLKSLGFRRYPNFFGLLYSRFFINLSYSTVTAYLLYYLQDAIGPKDKATLHQGIVIVVATLAGLIGTIAVGRMADSISKKHLVYVACGILGFGALIFAFINTFAMVLAIAFIFGAGWGAFSAVDWALAVNLLPEPEDGAARYMAVWHVCLTLPQVIAPVFGPVADRLNAQYGNGMGWRAAMLSTVIYLVIGAALLHRVNEKPGADAAVVPAADR